MPRSSGLRTLQVMNSCVKVNGARVETDIRDNEVLEAGDRCGVLRVESTVRI
jgi:hypothetical protein